MVGVCLAGVGVGLILVFLFPYMVEVYWRGNTIVRGVEGFVFSL